MPRKVLPIQGVLCTPWCSSETHLMMITGILSCPFFKDLRTVVPSHRTRTYEQAAGPDLGRSL